MTNTVLPLMGAQHKFVGCLRLDAQLHARFKMCPGLTSVLVGSLGPALRLSLGFAAATGKTKVFLFVE